jgi:hypothetical protein
MLAIFGFNVQQGWDQLSGLNGDGCMVDTANFGARSSVTLLVHLVAPPWVFHFLQGGQRSPSLVR